MRNVTLRLGQEIEEVTANAIRLKRRTHALDQDIDRLVKEKDLIKQQLNNNAYRFECLRDSMIVESFLEHEVLRKRAELVRAKKNSKRDDITVAKKRQLERLVKRTLTTLQSICQHTLILSYDGYEGDAYHEWDNARYGERKCAICELSETSASTREDLYKVLDDKEGRLIKRDLRESEKDWTTKQAPFQSLSYIIEAFRRSAGDMNVQWPIVQDGKITNNSDPFRPII